MSANAFDFADFDNLSEINRVFLTRSGLVACRYILCIQGLHICILIQLLCMDEYD